MPKQLSKISIVFLSKIIQSSKTLRCLKILPRQYKIISIYTFLQFDFPFIHVLRVKQFKFRPLVDNTKGSHDTSTEQRLVHHSVWNCDGEVMEEGAIDVRWALCVHCVYYMCTKYCTIILTMLLRQCILAHYRYNLYCHYWLLIIENMWCQVSG